ncbi:peptidoglycan DD-metalloendopeptidase family protein [Actinoallomurus sp. NPDC052308]|uniref:M23 family metallopeptidase n=1 Tax=Actinoallomurus sp. NPDC052308 TaxID=3155530 RepID=UPI003413D469
MVLPATLLVIAVSPARITAPGAGPPGWQWPLRPPPRVVRGFDPPAHPWESGHRGVDLATPPGRPVFAAGPGRVAFARDLAGRGVVTIVHGALRTTYLPVRPTVRAGQVVPAGARIGVVEAILGHCGQDGCLHWGLLRGDSYLDPLSVLGLGPVRLLPWWRSGASATMTGDGGRGPYPPTVPAQPAEDSPARRRTALPPTAQPNDPPPATALNDPFMGAAPDGPSTGTTPDSPFTGAAPDDPFMGAAPDDPLTGTTPDHPLAGAAPDGTAPATRPVGATTGIGAAVDPVAITAAAGLALFGLRARRRRERIPARARRHDRRVPTHITARSRAST